MNYLVSISEACVCGSTIEVTAGRHRNSSNPANPRGAEEIVERWRSDHVCQEKEVLK